MLNYQSDLIASDGCSKLSGFQIIYLTLFHIYLFYIPDETRQELKNGETNGDGLKNVFQCNLTGYTISVQVNLGVFLIFCRKLHHNLLISMNFQKIFL